MRNRSKHEIGVPSDLACCLHCKRIISFRRGSWSHIGDGAYDHRAFPGGASAYSGKNNSIERSADICRKMLKVPGKL